MTTFPSKELPAGSMNGFRCKNGEIFACVPGKENEPEIGERYRVNRKCASSGIVEVTDYCWKDPGGTITFGTFQGQSYSPFWWVNLVEVAENPCTIEYMVEIST